MSRGAPALDAMLLPQEAAKWLRIKPRALAAKSRGPKAKIPAFRVNERVIRYHPRTIIAKLAHDAGVTPDVIAQSLCVSIVSRCKTKPLARKDLR